MLALLLCTEAAVTNALMHLSRSLQVTPASAHPCSLIALNILSLCSCSCGNLRCLRLDGGVSSFTLYNCLVGLAIYACIRTGTNLHLHPHLVCQLLSFLSWISNNPHVSFVSLMVLNMGWGRSCSFFCFFFRESYAIFYKKLPSLQKTFGVWHVCLFLNACIIKWFSFRISTNIIDINYYLDDINLSMRKLTRRRLVMLLLW